MALPILLPLGLSMATSAAGEVAGKALNKVGLTGMANVVRNTTQAASGGFMGATANNIVNTLSPSAR